MLILFAVSFGNDPNARPSALVGTTAHTFELVDLDGNTVKMSDLAGKAVVLNFWSTWCGPCKYEHPLLQQAASVAPADVVFLGVIYSDDPQKVRRYLKSAGSAYPNLIDPDNRVAIDYGVTGVPESFFIDKTGVIRHKQAGPLDPHTLREKLAEVMQ